MKPGLRESAASPLSERRRGPLPARRSGAGAPRVTLIRPAMVSSAGNWSNPVTPPLGLAYLAAVLRESGTPVQVVDGIGEAVDQFVEEDGYRTQGLSLDQVVARIDPGADVIGISCMFTQDWPWMASLLEAIRERFPRALLIAGGEHVTALPEFTLRESPVLDLCVLGEGEETLVDLVEHWREGREPWQVPGIAYLRDGAVVRTPSRERIRAVDAIPRPAWDLFPMEVYLTSKNAHGVYRGRSMGILATRGCPYKCTFCSNPVMYGKYWFARSPEDVLDEIEENIRTWGAQNIDFYDLTMVLKRSWILEFCRLIEERGLSFLWQLPTGTRSEVLDPEVAAALHRTGCRNMTLAPESGSTDTLRKIKKQVKPDKVLASIRNAVGNGLRVKCNIVIGFPHETRRHVAQTLRFCWKLAALGVHDLPVFLFTPYPGSALFQELRDDGTLPDLDDAYMRSLVTLMDPFTSSPYCRHIGPRELLAWRWLIMATFYTISFSLRPQRVARLIASVVRNQDSDTVLEQRLAARLRRPAGRAAIAAQR